MMAGQEELARVGHILPLTFASHGLWIQYFIYLGISVLIREMKTIVHLSQKVEE